MNDEIPMPIGNYFRVDGLDIYYETSGKGFPVLFLHTAGTDGRIWKPFVDQLPGSFLAIVPDLPGHGKSWPWGTWRQDRVDVSFYAELIVKLLDGLGIREVIIVGCSIGAVIALKLGTMIGKRIPLIISIEGADKTETFTEDEIINVEPGSVERAFNYCGRVASKEAIENLLWIRTSNPRNIYVTDLLAWNAFDIRSELKMIESEVLLLRGEYDPIVTEKMVEETAKALKNASSQSLEGFGHYPMIEDPKKLSEFLLPLLEKSIQVTKS